MALDNNKLIVQSNTFQGGLVTLFPPHLLEDGATPSCQNVDFSRSYGRLTKRRGHEVTVDVTALGEVLDCQGLYEFINAAGTISLFEAIDHRIYKATAPSTLLEVYRAATNQAVTLIEKTGGVGDDYRITVPTHGYSTGNNVTFWGASDGIVPVTGNSYTITVLDVNRFTLDGTNGSAGAASEIPTNIYVYLTSTRSSAMGDLNFTTFDDLCIAVGSGISTLKSTGTYFTPLLGTPPANAKYVESHKGKVFIANHGGGKSRLSWSVTDNPEDWTTITGAATDAGFNDVGLDDGDTITGIKSVGSVLVIFKNTSTWVMSGNDTTDFKFRKIASSVGCVAPRSIVGCDTFVIFLSDLGVYSANSDGVVMLSYNIKPTAEGWSSAVKQTAVAGRLNTQYWLALDEDGSGSTNEVVYYLDYVLGVWGKYTAPSVPKVFVTRRGGALISAGKSPVGGATKAHIVTHDTTENDAGAAITMIWDSPDFDFDDWVKVKHPLDVIVEGKGISGKTLVVSHIVDGALIATTLTFTLTPVGSKDKAYFLKRGFPSTSFGRLIRLRFTNTEASAPVEVYAFSIRASIEERRNG